MALFMVYIDKNILNINNIIIPIILKKYRAHN